MQEEINLEELKSLEKDQITVDVLEKLAAKCYALREEKAEIKKASTKKEAELKDHQIAMGVLMDKLEIDSYRSKSGTISKREEANYRLPQDDSSRKAFFAYLKEREVFDTMITVNSKTLQSFVKQEVALKELDGEFDSLPPGIEETQYHTVYSMRK